MPQQTSLDYQRTKTLISSKSSKSSISMGRSYWATKDILKNNFEDTINTLFLAATNTALKVSIFGVFLVRIFTHLSVFSPNEGIYEPG